MSYETIMKHLTVIFIFLIILLQSCKKTIPNDGVPSYISIPSIDVMIESGQGSESQKITDAWVYINNDLQGIYPLPARFPVLKEGSQNLSVKAGIKNNGIAATRINYPFYDFYTQDIYLKKDSTTVIHPEVRYFDNTLFHIIDFEDGSETFELSQDSDTSFLPNNDSVFEGKSGAVHLAPPHLYFEITTKELQLPKLGTPVYVELNYRCNSSFDIGVYADFSPTIVTTSIVTVNPKNEWNKIYVDLTSPISTTQQANNHKVFISMRRDVNSDEEATLYLDNFKVIY